LEKAIVHENGTSEHAVGDDYLGMEIKNKI
jgi:hypothetical protein